ncbi:hypothetical protein ABZP36_030858 [Zizania latifolia]
MAHGASGQAHGELGLRRPRPSEHDSTPISGDPDGPGLPPCIAACPAGLVSCVVARPAGLAMCGTGDCTGGL